MMRRQTLKISLFLLGLSSITAQIVLLRELLVSFLGNDLTLGIILANWLILVAAGSFLIGKSVEKVERKLEVFVVFQLVFSVAFPSAIFLCRIFKNMLLLPFTPLTPPPGQVTLFVAVNMLFFALLSSGVVFLLYYRLIADVGPTKSLTVTFLMPAFTMIWAALFLGESITAVMIVGCALILAGTGMVVARK